MGSEERIDLDAEEGVLGSALELIEVTEVAPLLAGASGGEAPFSAAELAYARGKPDPEQRLAARLAAKRAACRLLGEGIEPADVEVLPGVGGPPRLRLSARARVRLRALGASRLLVSLTHERTHAAAAVLLLREKA